MTADPVRGRLYVAMDNQGGVAVIDTASGAIVEVVPTAPPPALLGATAKPVSAGANGVALSPDRRTLLVTSGAENALVVVLLASPVDRTAKKVKTTSTTRTIRPSIHGWSA